MWLFEISVVGAPVETLTNIAKTSAIDDAPESEIKHYQICIVLTFQQSFRPARGSVKLLRRTCNACHKV